MTEAALSAAGSCQNHINFAIFVGIDLVHFESLGAEEQAGNYPGDTGHQKE